MKTKPCKKSECAQFNAELNEVLAIGQIHKATYTAPPFLFCPWCGAWLEIEPVSEIETSSNPPV